MRNKNGFTLIEFAICLGLIVIVVATAGYSLRRLQVMEMDAKKKSGTEAARMELTKYLRLAFSQAIAIENAPIAVVENSPTGVGKVKPFCFGASSCSPSNLTAAKLLPLAYFWRETQLGETAPAQSFFQPTGIFFQNPTVNQAGVIVITPNSLIASESGLKFGGIVEFEVKDIKTATGLYASANRVTSLQVRWVQRWQMDENMDSWGWCPAADFAIQCAGKSERFRDRETVINIPLRDNWLGVNPTLESSGGSDANRDIRLFDRVYFFQTETRSKQ